MKKTMDLYSSIIERKTFLSRIRCLRSICIGIPDFDDNEPEDRRAPTSPLSIDILDMNTMRFNQSEKASFDPGSEMQRALIDGDHGIRD